MAAQPLVPQTEPLAEAPDASILPSWRLPEARRDKEARLAILLRNILYQHDKDGCAATNAWLAKNPTLGIDKDVSTVRRLLGDLEECGLIVREFDEYNVRTIRPLVTAAELIAAGWVAFARAIQGMRRWPALLRARCRDLLASADKQRRNYAGSARSTPAIERPLRVEEREAFQEETTTARRASRAAKPGEVVVVPPAEAPDPEAVKLAVDAGLPEGAARKAVAGKPAGVVRRAIEYVREYSARKEIRSPIGLLRAAIEGEWSPPAPPSSYGSDRGERPQRIVVTPPLAMTAETDRAPESDAANRAWESLSESEKGELLRAALAEVLAGDSESERAQARRRGIDSAFVEIRAKRAARKRLCVQ